MEELYIFHGTAAHILGRNYTFSTETLPNFYRTVIHFVRKGCIFSTENPVHIRFYGSVMYLLRNSYTFSKEALHIFYGTCVSLTGHRNIALPLTHTINLSMQTGLFPSEWKSAKITPIHKSARGRILTTMVSSQSFQQYRK